MTYKEAIDAAWKKYEEDWIKYYNQWKAEVSKPMILIEYNPKTMASSCCGGKGVSIWKPNSQRWECADCGTVTSNDPSYVLNNGVRELPQWALKSPKKCECGSDKVGNGGHSTWCPKYEAY